MAGQMKRLAELVVLPWVILGAIALMFLLYVVAPPWIWLASFGFVVWRCHWLRRDP